MNQEINVTNLIKNNNKVKFEYYEEGFLYYSIFCGDLQVYLIFPVDINNFGKGKIMLKAFSSDSASIFLPYLRLAHENNQLIRKAY